MKIVVLILDNDRTINGDGPPCRSLCDIFEFAPEDVEAALDFAVEHESQMKHMKYDGDVEVHEVEK